MGLRGLLSPYAFFGLQTIEHLACALPARSEATPYQSPPMAAPGVILGRVPRIATASTGAEPGDDAEADPADFSLAVALPPRVAVLAAARSAHPDPARPDRYPYILAAGPGCLLSRFSAAPFHGARFGPDPPETHLVLVRRFGTDAGGSGTHGLRRAPSPTAPAPCPPSGTSSASASSVSTGARAT